MLSMLQGLKKPHHYIRLNTSFRADLYIFLILEWSIHPISPQSASCTLKIPHRHLGFIGLHSPVGRTLVSTFMGILPLLCLSMNCELLPVVLAAGTWGHYWSGKMILCHSDNEAVVNMINTGSCKKVMHCLFFIEAKLNVTLTARHIPGKYNTDADTLSRDGIFLYCVLSKRH